MFLEVPKFEELIFLRYEMTSGWFFVLVFKSFLYNFGDLMMVFKIDEWKSV